MATERLPMRKIKDILRQKWLLGRRHRQIARALKVGVGTVSSVVGRAADAELTWEQVEALDESELERRLYTAVAKRAGAPLPEAQIVDLELRKPGVTLRLLHLEYREAHPDGYGYTQFCDHYRRWKKRQRLVMRQTHRAGEKVFSDYAGKKPHWIDPMTGEVHEAELFVAVLGASNYTYAEATETQKIGDWCGSHTRALEYIGGVPELVVPDQLKSAVTRASRYEPEIQRTFQEWASHYGTVILPARPARPRDKAKVEVAVQIVERWVLARLRHQQFFSLGELNARIRELVEELNTRIMRRYGKRRRQLFETLDRPVLKALPAERFVVAEWKQVRVHIDYHVALEFHYYSAPHQLVGQDLDARLTPTTVELFLKGQRVAVHPRSLVRGHYTTLPAHMPKAHLRHADWSPARLIRWAQKIGPMTAQLVEAILHDRPHPEQGYRSCLGIMRLGRGYGAARLEAACTRAFLARARSYRHVESILKSGLDRLPPPAAPPPAPRAGALHENVRGESYYG
jgi:transposase